MNLSAGGRLRSPALLVGFAVWAVSLALYISTLAPTITWGYNNYGVDGPELLTAAHSLGVPHPPGYPTYTVLLKAFATVIRVGDYAYRGNLMSAVLGAFSAGLLYWAILRFSESLWPGERRSHAIVGAALGATVFAASPLFWSQAVMTEVYTLNALFSSALLVIATHLSLPRSDGGRDTGPGTGRKLALFGLLFGLGLGNHLTLLAVALPLVYWMWTTLGWRRLVSTWSVLFFALGLAIYVYLPVSASKSPPVNWGDASTASGFGWMLTARVYQDYVFGVPGQFIAARIVRWVALVFTQLNPLGIFLALAGAPTLASKQRHFLAASSVTVAALSIYSITYNAIDFIVLMIPAFMLLSAWVGIGSASIISATVSWAGQAKRPASGVIRAALSHPVLILGIIAFGGLPVTSLILNYSSQDLSDDRAAYERATGIMAAVPDGSVVLSKEEDATFSLWYVRYVADRNRNVATIAVPLLQFDWYWRDLQARFPDRIPREATTDVLEALKRIVAHNKDSGVYFTYGSSTLRDLFELRNVYRQHIWDS